MEYTLRFSQRAENDLDEIVGTIQADSPVHATVFRVRLLQRMKAIEQFPLAWTLAPESQIVGQPIRQMSFDNYRVLFPITDTVVTIVTIRHGARQFMTKKELDE